MLMLTLTAHDKLRDRNTSCNVLRTLLRKKTRKKRTRKKNKQKKIKALFVTFIWTDHVLLSFIEWVCMLCCACRAVSICLPYITDSQVFDVKALRAFRVLRPLKLVSGVPSERSHFFDC